jgi:hypothetical protein
MSLTLHPALDRPDPQQNPATDTGSPATTTTAATPAAPPAAAASGEPNPRPANPDPDPAALIEQLHDGSIEPGQLTGRQRRQCVEHLTEAGFTNEQVARFMRVCVRTVRRDRARLRRLHAVHPGVELGDQLLGEFGRQTDAALQRLTRLATDPNTPAYARLWAEESISRISHRYFEAARRAGYIEGGDRRIRNILKEQHNQRCRAEGIVPGSREDLLRRIME